MSVSAGTIQAILDAGILAPSGDNCQPWRFEVEDDRISLYNISDRDVSQYNFRQRASLIAHGALIENLSIAASAYGMEAEIQLFPDNGDVDHVADVRIAPGNIIADPLSDWIAARCTNRRRYDRGVLNEIQHEKLISAADPFPDAQMHLVSGKDQEQIARVIGLNDRLVFENRELHAFLFDHIRWNEAEAEATRDGMDIRTLELTPPDSIAFRLFKSFNLVSFLNYFGISRIIGGNARKLAMSAAAIGVVTMKASEPADYLTCGRVMERVWLEATRQGLAFQLMTGIACLMGRVLAGDPGALSPEHVEMVKAGRRELKGVLGLDAEEPQIIFRVGIAAGPTARSLRQPVRL